MGTISALSFSEASRIAFDTDKTIAHTKGYVISQKGYTNHDVVLLLSSSCQVKFCENFTNEDNFNNTFSLKSFRTTAVATEFRGKGNTIFQDSKNKTVLCCIKPILRVYMLIFISRKGRKGRRTSNANHATAEAVAGYARRRAQRRNRNGTIHPQRTLPQPSPRVELESSPLMEH